MTVIGKLRALLSRREKKFLFLLLGASMFVSFLETFSISLIMVFASVAMDFELIFKNKYYNYGYKFLGCTSPYQFVVFLGLGLVVFYIFRGIIISLFTYSMSRFSQGRFKHFAFKFFQNYLNFKYKDFTTKHSSTVAKVIFTDTNQLTAVVTAILTISAESLTVGFVYLALLYVNWKVTFVLTFVLGLKVMIIAKVFSKKLEKAGENTNKLSVELSKAFTESFGNFKLIKLLSNEQPILKRFERACAGLVRSNTLNAMLQSSPRIILETIGFSILILVITYVVYVYHNASGVIPIVSMYALAFYRLLPSINKILSEYNRILFFKHSLDSVKEYLDYDLESLENSSIEFHSKIELKNVSFGYDKKNKVLKNVNIVLKKGQRTAFIGESGGGKSTIVDIIMGLYKTQTGGIYVDNQELTNTNIKSWRSKVGYIPQQIYLFDATVADNIVFGREYNKQKIIEVLKQANIYNYLLTQDGIDTRVGEGGIKLSGGQKQRIAIARALYSDPEILVLDEATSALDNATEVKIMDEVYNLNKNKTLIVVAHRLSTIQRCEVIYKIEKGNVFSVDDLYSSLPKSEDVYKNIES